MSHFAVAVLTKHGTNSEIEELLNPFYEQTEDPAYLELILASESMEEIRSTYEQNKDEYEDFEDFLMRYYGYVYNEETDEAGYMANPNAKWDWWQVGGRWSDFLRLKSGKCVNSAQLKDVDLEPDKDEYKKAERWWEVCVEKSPLRPGENETMFWSMFKPEYYIEQFKTKENYANQQAKFNVWAILTQDGQWEEKGNMGWFGVSDATNESREQYAKTLEDILKTSDQELYITIVDCHI